MNKTVSLNMSLNIFTALLTKNTLSINRFTRGWQNIDLSRQKDVSILDAMGLGLQREQLLPGS
jgi:hypothetical protein